MLRYANHSIFSVSETYPGFKTWNRVNVSNYNSLGPVLLSTLNGVINDATRNSSRGHFATKSANWTSFDKVYCLAQCTPDLTEFDCTSCLTIARNIMIGSYSTSMDVGIFHASCQLRYDTTQQFYMDMHSQVPNPFGSNTTLPGRLFNLFFRPSGKR
ncbi:Cysteine-rich receptor-like protein kinase 25 [Bienertia sinuspersici]